MVETYMENELRRTDASRQRHDSPASSHSSKPWMRSTKTSTNVLVAHSTLLIAEGMASMLGREPRLSVNLSRAPQGSRDSGTGADINVVFADVESIRRSRWTSSRSTSQRVEPKIILVTGRLARTRGRRPKRSGT